MKKTIALIFALALLLTATSAFAAQQDTIWRGIESGYAWNTRADSGTGALCDVDQCSSNNGCYDAGEPYRGNVPLGGSSASWICADTAQAAGGTAFYRCGIDGNGWPNKLGKTLHDLETGTNWCCTTFEDPEDDYVFTAGRCEDIQTDCEGDYEFDVQLAVVGENCIQSPNIGPTDTEVINVPVSGYFDVEGRVARSIPPQIQDNEVFTVEVNGVTGPLVPDNAPDDEIIRVQFAGNFPFEAGNNEVLMETGAQCPPDNSPESVTVTKICLTLTDTPVCDENLDCNDDNMCTEDVCVNPGTPESYCSNYPTKPGSVCEDDGDLCTDDFCDGAGVCIHEDNNMCVCESNDDCPSSANDCEYPVCVNPGTPDAFCDFEDEPQGTVCADDGDLCTDDYCDGFGVCAHPVNDLCVCETNEDCNDGNECTLNECVNGGTPDAYCETTNLPPDTVCTDDGDTCTDDFCNGEGVCEHPVNDLCVCHTNEDCNDQNECTLNECVNPGTSDAYCETTPQPYGTVCTDDGDVCTDDFCDGTDACIHEDNGLCVDCEEAILQGLIYGTADGTNATVTNNAMVGYDVGFASYKMIDDNIQNQILFDSDVGFVDPNTTIHLIIDVPECRYQTDLFCGDVVEEFITGDEYTGRLLDSEFGGGPEYCEPDNEPHCYSRIQDAHVMCDGGDITNDEFGGCRSITCEGDGTLLQVLACDKPSSIDPVYFEMYKQSQIGNGLEICFSETCIDEHSGFARSPDYPICYEPPVCTDVDEDGYAIEGEMCGPIDCDDTNASINPGAEEICNQVDDNCDGQIDEGDVCSPSCTDADEDGFFAEGGSCGPTDCNDANPNINPNATEICNGLDDNCDGQVDEGDVCGQVCFEHSCEIPAVCNGGTIVELYSPETGGCEACRTIFCQNGDNTLQVLACDKPDGVDPSYFEMYKQAQTGNGLEICLTETCIDEYSGFARSEDFPICTDEPPECTDDDGDSYAVEGGLCGEFDCDDTDPNVHPNAEEICNQIDDNCALGIDEGGVCSVCGNSIIEDGEECDDGNTENGDGCDSTCQIENPETCFETVADAPASCSIGEVTLDVFTGCRAVSCETENDGTQVLACDKPGGYFEMYLQSSWGAQPELCLGDTCLNPKYSGFAQSPLFPICVEQ